MSDHSTETPRSAEMMIVSMESNVRPDGTYLHYRSFFFLGGKLRLSLQKKPD